MDNLGPVNETINQAKEEVVNAPLNMLYVDDSGSEKTGIAVFGWIESTPHEWKDGLSSWLDFRKLLYKNYRIPPATELHATELNGGRGQPSTDPAVNASKVLQREALHAAITATTQLPNLRLGTVYRDTGLRGKKFELERTALYAKLIQSLESRFARCDQYAVIFMDDDGTDPSYRRAHRNLDLNTRRVLEDPLFQQSHQSQWVQIADIVAWTTFQSLKRCTTNGQLYNQHLRAFDINGGPQAL